MLNIRVDRETKDKVKKIYDDWGLTLTAAVNIFFKRSIIDNGLPFDMKIPRVPNEDTLEAMNESEKILKSGKSRFKNANEMFENLEI